MSDPIKKIIEAQKVLKNSENFLKEEVKYAAHRPQEILLKAEERGEEVTRQYTATNSIQEAALKKHYAKLADDPQYADDYRKMIEKGREQNAKNQGNLLG